MNKEDRLPLLASIVTALIIFAANSIYNQAAAGSLVIEDVQKYSPIAARIIPEIIQEPLRLGWPIDLVDYVALSSPFGERDPAKIGGYGDDFHDGLDLFGTWHARIRSSANAYIACVFPAPGGRDRGHAVLGGLVILEFKYQGDTYYLVYGHLSEVLVREGSHSEVGTLLGRQGNSGRSANDHLHFAVNKNGELNIDTGEITGGEWLNPLQHMTEPRKTI